MGGTVVEEEMAGATFPEPGGDEVSAVVGAGPVVWGAAARVVGGTAGPERGVVEGGVVEGGVVEGGVVEGGVVVGAGQEAGSWQSAVPS